MITKKLLGVIVYSVNINAIKTRRFLPPKDSYDDLLAYFDGKLFENSVVSISSKVIGICEGSCIPEEHIAKQLLISQQSTEILSRTASGDALLTRKQDMLLEYGGVDMLKAGYYVTLPEHPYKIAMSIWKSLRKRNHIRHLGVIITDSHSVPYRRGAIGMAIAGYGFRPITPEGVKTRKHRKVSMLDTIDSLAAAANIVMGEGAESMPITVITDVPHLKFFGHPMPPSIMRSYLYVRSGEVYDLTKTNIDHS